MAGRLAVARVDPRTSNYDLWLLDVAHGTDSRFTFNPGNSWSPVWSPDGSRILFAASHGLKWGIYQKPTTGAGKEELLYETPNTMFLSDWSRDGRFAIFSVNGTGGLNVWVLPLSGDHKPFPFLQTQFAESRGRFSPDGRWLTYQSNETGTLEIYVQTFPGKEGKWHVSAKGGSRPVWGKDGKELFYLAPDGKMMAVDVKTSAEFAHGSPKPLFNAQTVGNSLAYDVASDGKRFLIVRSPTQASTPPMTMVLNWQAALKK